MKLKKRKGSKFEKEVKPVKKSVALVLTIVTVFAFAAADFRSRAVRACEWMEKTCLWFAAARA